MDDVPLVQVKTVDGHRWGLIKRIDPEYPFDEDEDTDDVPMVIVALADRPDGPHYAYALVDLVMRGTSTAFYVALHDREQLYYGGDSPAHASDGMVFTEGWEDTPPLPPGNYYRARDLDDIGDLVNELKAVIGPAMWSDVSELEPDPEQGMIEKAKDVIERIFDKIGEGWLGR